MPLDRDELRRIARLARLALTAEEEHLFAAQLGRVVDYFDRLGELEADPPDVAGVLSSAVAEAEDLPAPGLARETVLALAPAVADELFLVPAVLASPGESRTGRSEDGLEAGGTLL